MKNLLLIFILSFCCFCNLHNSDEQKGGALPISISKLRCEYIENPEGIDIPKPRLSWNLVSTGRGQLQTAYQVLVASSQEMLTNKYNKKSEL